MRYQAYQSLLDHRIRSAWLYALYLSPPNFTSVATPLYITPTSTSYPVRLTLSSQLQSAAESELLKASPKIDVDDLYAEADKAFEALSILLADNEWFFSAGEGITPEPTLFDASVFAYTHLLISPKLGWKDKKLVQCVTRRQNLVDHSHRTYTRYWGSE